MYNRIFAVSFMALWLSACGGGGGSSEPAMMNPALAPAMHEQQQPLQQTAFEGDNQQGVTAIGTVAPTISSALSLASETVFGSIVQTANRGLSSPVSVETVFTGARFTFLLNRRDNSTLFLDTDVDGTSVVQRFTGEENTVTNRSTTIGRIVRTNDDGVTVGSAAIEWSDDDFGNYLAGGHWIHVDAARNVEFGAFIDGTDYKEAVTVPVSGSATYTGRAGGMYLGTYGTELSALYGRPAGTLEAGEYLGTLHLTADFSSNMISGGVTNISLFDIAAFPESGLMSVEDRLASGFEIDFGTTLIKQDGQFTGTTITLRHPLLNMTSSGSWSGRFSTVDDASGNPRAVAGTHHGHATTPEGTEAIFIGSHYGATERFQ
ncbi:MAG: hypothetical protein F4X93_02285 [Proteobacteria bacterium]|nr:hypothetical protein [Pseudomonadota bacterium]